MARFLHISDLHFTDQQDAGLVARGMTWTSRDVLAGLAASVDLQAFDFVAVTGDLVNNGTTPDYVALREALDETFPADMPRVMVLGNHDDKAAFRAGYLGEDASDAPYREVSEIDGLRLVTLDTSVSYQHGGIVDADHVDWLADVLATRAQNGTLLFGHHPFGISWKPQLEKAETHPRLAEVLAASDVRAIFNGHLHMPVASMAFDIPQFTAAPLSFGILRNGEQLWDTDRLGYSSVEVTPDGVSVQPEILHPRVHIIGPNDMWEEYENQAQLWAQQKGRS